MDIQRIQNHVRRMDMRRAGRCVENVEGRGMCLRPAVRLDRRGLCSYHRQKYGLNKGANNAHTIQRKITRERNKRSMQRYREFYRRNGMLAGLEWLAAAEARRSRPRVEARSRARPPPRATPATPATPEVEVIDLTSEAAPAAEPAAEPAA